MFSDFFNVNDNLITLREFQNKTLKIYNQDSCFVVLRDVADAASFLIRTILDDDPEIEFITVNLEDEFNDFFLISDYLNRKLIRINSDNKIFLKQASEFFQISSLILKIEEFEDHFEKMTKNENITALETYDSIICSITEKNYQCIAENMSFFSFIDENDPDSDYEIFGNIILKFILNNYLSAPLLLKFVKLLNQKKVSNTIVNLAYKIKQASVKKYIFQVLADTGIATNLQFYNFGDETAYKRLYGNSLLEFDNDDVWVDKSLLQFIENANDIRKEIEDYDIKDRMSQKIDKKEDDQKTQKKSFITSFLKKSEETKEITMPRFCEICLNLRRKGVNPSAICSAIREDDVDSFQRISANDSLFKFNSKVPFSRFESKSLLIRCSLAEYAAFFGSIKCFKYILLNYDRNSTFSESEKNIVKYAIAGRNIEIIRLCEQNGCSFDSYALKCCIKFRNSEIFEWIIMNKVQLYGMNMGCTINITGRRYVKQPWFECSKCNLTRPYGCCLYCATHCHKNHQLISRGSLTAYCDCSVRNEGEHYCQGMAKVICKKENETGNENNNNNNNDNDNIDANHNDANGNNDNNNLNNDDFDNDDDYDNVEDDVVNSDWEVVNDLIPVHYHGSDMVKHLDLLSLCQVDYLVYACIRHHNYSALHRLIELGANLKEMSPKFFMMATPTNNVRLAKLAIILGKPESGNKCVYDTFPKSMDEADMSRQMKRLGAEAMKKQIINIEKNCTIC